MATSSDPVLYKCCQCDLYVTDRVTTACTRGPSVHPFQVAERDAKHKPLRVRVQCPSGHWCEYPCSPPEVSRD